MPISGGLGGVAAPIVSENGSGLGAVITVSTSYPAVILMLRNGIAIGGLGLSSVGVTSFQYRRVAADVGQTLTPEVIPVGQSVGDPPGATTTPSLSTSSPKVGSYVTPTPDVYTSAGAVTVAAQWFYGDTGALIAGAPTSSGAAYLPVTADLGHTLKYIETASNISGATPSAAPTTGQVGSNPATAISYSTQALLFGGVNLLY